MVGEDSGRPAGDGVELQFHVVTDPRQARLLTDPTSQHYFRPFLARDVTVSSVAAELSSDVNRVLYRIRRFLEAGLIHVVRELPRAGRSLKVYRSVHDAYLIPYEVTPFGTLEERLMEQALVDLRQRVRVQARRMARRGWSGQRLYRNSHGETWTTSAPDGPLEQSVGDGIGSWPVAGPGRRDEIDFWTDLYLSEEEAAGLQRRLAGELEGLEGRQPFDETEGLPTRRRYRFSVALLPLEE